MRAAITAPIPGSCSYCATVAVLMLIVPLVIFPCAALEPPLFFDFDEEVVIGGAPTMICCPSLKTSARSHYAYDGSN